jgi:hypothetical protein
VERIRTNVTAPIALAGNRRQRPRQRHQVVAAVIMVATVLLTLAYDMVDPAPARATDCNEFPGAPDCMPPWPGGGNPPNPCDNGPCTGPNLCKPYIRKPELTRGDNPEGGGLYSRVSYRNGWDCDSVGMSFTNVRTRVVDKTTGQNDHVLLEGQPRSSVDQGLEDAGHVDLFDADWPAGQKVRVELKSTVAPKPGAQNPERFDGWLNHLCDSTRWSQDGLSMLSCQKSGRTVNLHLASAEISTGLVAPDFGCRYTSLQRDGTRQGTTTDPVERFFWFVGIQCHGRAAVTSVSSRLINQANGAQLGAGDTVIHGNGFRANTSATVHLPYRANPPAKEAELIFSFRATAPPGFDWARHGGNNQCPLMSSSHRLIKCNSLQDPRILEVEISSGTFDTGVETEDCELTDTSRARDVGNFFHIEPRVRWCVWSPRWDSPGWDFGAVSRVTVEVDPAHVVQLGPFGCDPEIIENTHPRVNPNHRPSTTKYTVAVRFKYPFCDVPSGQQTFKLERIYTGDGYVIKIDDLSGTLSGRPRPKPAPVPAPVNRFTGTSGVIWPGASITVAGELFTPPNDRVLVTQGDESWVLGPISPGSKVLHDSESEITMTLPGELREGSAELRVVNVDGYASDPLPITVIDPDPVINPNGVVNPSAGYTPNNIRAGSLVAIFGQFTPPGDTVVVTQSGKSWTLGPGSLNWYDSFHQVNVTLPDDLHPGQAQVKVVSASGKQSQPATITIVGPTINPDGVTNPGAGYTGQDIQPGTVAAVFGKNFIPGTDKVLITAQDGAEFTVQSGSFGWYDSAGQINFQVPTNLPPGQAQVRVQNNSGTSNPVTITVAILDPRINPNGVLNPNAADASGAWTAANIQPGSLVAIFGDRFTHPGDRVTVSQGTATWTIGPGSPGWFDTYNQINATLPANLQPGQAQVEVVNLHGRRSARATITIVPLGPLINPDGVTNPGAGYTGQDIQPGTVAAIFGSNFVPGTDKVLITAQGGAQFTVQSGSFGWYDSAGQINFQVPTNLPPGQATVRVQNGKGTSYPATITVAILDPRINPGGVVNPNANYTTNNIRAGTLVAIFGDRFTHPGDRVIVSQGTATWTIGPGSPGWFDTYNQINATLPTGLQPGQAQVRVVNLHGRQSEPVTIPIVG